MAFLVLLFVEWGSHGLAFSHAYSPDGLVSAVGADEQGHEDPCKTMVHGTDGSRQERPVPNFGHDLRQATAFFYIPVAALNDLQPDPRSVRSKVSVLFRPVSPPYHPPELS